MVSPFCFEKNIAPQSQRFQIYTISSLLESTMAFHSVLDQFTGDQYLIFCLLANSIDENELYLLSTNCSRHQFLVRQTWWYSLV